MPTSGTEKVPEEAVEAVYRCRHVSIHALPDAEQAVREAIRAELTAAYPAIRQSVLSEVKEGLLGEEAVEAGANAHVALHSRNSIETVIAGVLEAAINTITPEEEK